KNELLCESSIPRTQETVRMETVLFHLRNRRRIPCTRFSRFACKLFPGLRDRDKASPSCRIVRSSPASCRPGCARYSSARESTNRAIRPKSRPSRNTKRCFPPGCKPGSFRATYPGSTARRSASDSPAALRARKSASQLRHRKHSSPRFPCAPIQNARTCSLRLPRTKATSCTALSCNQSARAKRGECVSHSRDERIRERQLPKAYFH